MVNYYLKRIVYILFLIFWIVVSIILCYRLKRYENNSTTEVSGTGDLVENLRSFEGYSIENLSKARIVAGNINVVEEMSSENEFTSYLFEFKHDPTLSYNGDIKVTTGQINIPTVDRELFSVKYPVILMLRGYVDQQLYETGDGTKNAAAYFAENGYITIAPDFLGYGGSDEEAKNIFESRFQTYTTALSILKTIEMLSGNPNVLEVSSDIKESTILKNQLINKSFIFLWGHSNGGQIAITILEITKASYPTTLWAPVSKPFPYSILYYTDESEDRGKLIRSELAKFEADYDVEKYSLDNYFEFINSPLQVHQGTADDAVPIDWSDDFTDKLLELNLDLDYHTYPGADHNMRPVWNTVVSRDLEFFNRFID
jgi:dienelactone hydrolase